MNPQDKLEKLNPELNDAAPALSSSEDQKDEKLNPVENQTAGSPESDNSGVKLQQLPTSQNTTITTSPAPVSAPANQAQSDDSAAAGTVPQIADDTDLIEKEWVVKAKDIVDKTRDDPHLQTKEMSEYKAAYVKKRFNKEMPLNKE